jgi:phage FluMu protein Com
MLYCELCGHLGQESDFAKCTCPKCKRNVVTGELVNETQTDKILLSRKTSIDATGK